MKKASRLFVVLFFLLGSYVPMATRVSAAGFTDIDKSFAKDAIINLEHAGIISGFSESIFNPTAKITREQFVKILVLANGLDITHVPNHSTFKDIHTKDWASPYIEAATKANYIKGYSDGTFKPNANLSREQMAAMFVRSLGIDVSGYGSKLKFNDANLISPAFKDAVAFASEVGFIDGKKNGSFDPKGYASREEVAKVASSFLKEKEHILNPPSLPEEKPNPVPEPEVPLPNPDPQPEVPMPDPDPQPEVPTPDPQPEVPTPDPAPGVPAPEHLVLKVTQDGSYFVDLEWSLSENVRFDVYEGQTSDFSAAELVGQGEEGSDGVGNPIATYRFTYTPENIGERYYFVVAISEDGQSEPVVIQFVPAEHGIEIPTEPIVPPVLTARTYYVYRSLPHFTHAWDPNYANAVYEVALQLEGQEEVVYSVANGQVDSTPGDIVVIGHNAYNTIGKHTWTIKAEGYEDAIVDVYVIQIDIVDNATQQPITTLTEGEIWKLFKVTIEGDTFNLFDPSKVVFGGSFAGLTMNGFVPPGSGGLAANQVILDGVHGTITKGIGTITFKSDAVQSGQEYTYTVTVE